jgi:hypothetical protein
MTEEPIAWRVCVQPPHSYVPGMKSKAYFIQCNTKEAAEAEKQRQKSQYGEGAVIHIAPVFISRVERNRAYRSQQTTAAASWPMQARTAE